MPFEIPTMTQYRKRMSIVGAQFVLLIVLLFIVWDPNNSNYLTKKTGVELNCLPEQTMIGGQPSYWWGILVATTAILFYQNMKDLPMDDGVSSTRVQPIALLRVPRIRSTRKVNIDRKSTRLNSSH